MVKVIIKYKKGETTYRGVETIELNETHMLFFQKNKNHIGGFMLKSIGEIILENE